FRNIISPTMFGMDRFLQNRTHIQGEYSRIKENFINTMKRMYPSDEKENQNVHINRQDVKNMIYICENDKMQLNLLQKMMKRIFGPEDIALEYLKLLYHLKLPNEMRKVLDGKEFSKLFENTISYVIVMSLFYDYKLYNDVIDTYHRMISKNVMSIKSAKLQTILTMAACYHLDSSWSLQEATSIIKKQEEIHIRLDPKSLSFASALALKQNQSHLALELTSKTPWNSYMLKNLKILALVEVGRAEDALPILRGYSGGFSTYPSNEKNDNLIFSKTLISVKKALLHKGNNEALLEFTALRKELAKKSLITDKIIFNTLIEPMEENPQTNKNLARTMVQGSFERGRKRGKTQKVHKNRVGRTNLDLL
ncbi:hypothetical protein Anas_08584, partial [Armadillidium nasatum]